MLQRAVPKLIARLLLLLLSMLRWQELVTTELWWEHIERKATVLLTYTLLLLLLLRLLVELRVMGSKVLRTRLHETSDVDVIQATAITKTATTKLLLLLHQLTSLQLTLVLYSKFQTARGIGETIPAAIVPHP